MDNQNLPENSVAIVGMSGRFPGAKSVAEFWRNQLAGIESIAHFEINDLEIADQLIARENANYVRARSTIEDIDLFDADFFGIYPLEAKLMDPQQRLFLEICWEACEAAGYDPAAAPGPVGVFAGCSIPTYFLSRLCKQPDFIDRFVGEYQVGSFPELLGNGLDFFASKVAYKFNLKGPAITTTTACSTSLVAVSQACQSLLTYQCDMALAGGASISLPQKRGTLYIEGGMTSPDGHCRTFDANASGTVFGSAVGVVLLKRLEEAIEDGDYIHSVIRGFGVNNDGAGKVGYTAPSIEGQADVIAMAQEFADITPEMIGYVEAHGTGTPLGDPIELAALSKAFAKGSCTKQSCTIGTAKTNIGHLDAAAGVTGLIHASHIVKEGVLPQTLHFTKPNPKFDMENSPFKVSTKRTEWRMGDEKRRAGVSAFGVGGTNAHIVIEEAPRQPSSPSQRRYQLLPLSARSSAALEKMSVNLATHLEDTPDNSLADAAWTLQIGRRRFDHGKIIVAKNTTEAIEALQGEHPDLVQTQAHYIDSANLHFMFPGQGAQHLNMSLGLYRDEPVFRDAVDRCAGIITPLLDADLRTFLYPDEDGDETAADRLKDTAIAQLAIFTIEYALAQLWISWGMRPQVLLGHSVGEFTGACLAGVFSLEDALNMVAARGRLMHEVPPGGMLAVSLDEAQLVDHLDADLCIAAVNAPTACVVSGPLDQLERLEEKLKRDKILCRRLVTSHAFHSNMMDPVVGTFRDIVANSVLHPPKIPIISTVTGKPLTAEEATDPDYWAHHLRKPVRFADAVTHCLKDERAVLLEVGPGRTLNTLAHMCLGALKNRSIVSSQGGLKASEPDCELMMQALASLWLSGLKPDWRKIAGPEANERRRIPLPTYPFERKRYWLEFDEDKVTPSTNDSAVSQAPPVLSAPSPQKEPVPMTNPVPVNTTVNASKSASSAEHPTSRKDRIQSALVEIFEDLSDKDLQDTDGQATFLELGFDSLFLTQATRAVKEKIGTKVTFRQLLGDLNNFDALAAYADDKLDAAAFAAPERDGLETVSAPAVATPIDQPPAASIAPPLPASLPPTQPLNVAPAPSAHSQGLTEQLMREQLQTMNQVFSNQLQAIAGFSEPAIPATAIATTDTGANPLTSPPAAAQATPIPTVIETPGMPQAPIQSKPAPSASATASGEVKTHGTQAKIRLTPSTDLNDQQEAKIADIVQKYTRRTPRSKRLTQAHRSRLADPRVVSGFDPIWKEMVYPIITERSKGSKLWDVDGNELIDLLNGFGPILFGHRPGFVEDAMQAQLGKGFEIGPQTPLAGEIAEIFCDMTGNERMTFCNTGSEAVMAAMRLARTVTGRDKVVVFTGDYHGMFDEVLIKAHRAKDGTPGATPFAPGIPMESVSNMIVLDYGTDESLAWIRENAEELAAVIVEPVQSRRPDFQPIAFLKEVRSITEQSETAFIFDEVVTGFRTHPGGCQALFGIEADMATYGKVLGGGMPIGVLAGKAEFMDALDGGDWQFGDDTYPEVGRTFFAGTFVRHPLTLAAVKAVLLHLKDQGPSLQEGLAVRTEAMVRRINQVLGRFQVPTRVKYYKSFMYFDFDIEEKYSGLFYALLRFNGVHVQEGFPCFLTTQHSDADIDHIVQAFEISAKEMHEAELFLTKDNSIEPLISETELPAIQPTPSQAETQVPLTEPQQEILHATMYGDDVSCAFNESFCIRLGGSLDKDALRHAFDNMIARHEALRSVIDLDSKALRISPTTKIELEILDKTDLSGDANNSGLEAFLANDARTPFDLASGPLVRASLIQLDTLEHVLVFTAHHIICDGWSCSVIVAELAEFYTANVEQRPQKLPDAISFNSYARDAAAGDTEEKTDSENYWIDKFQTIPELIDLPTDRMRGDARTYAGTTLHQSIGNELTQRIKKVGAERGASLFSTLFASFNVLIHLLSKQEDLVIGIPMAGQSHIDGGNLVGHCVSFLPLRTAINGQTSFDDLIAQSRDNILDAYDHQSTTYGRLIQMLKLLRDPSRLPLTELQFNVEQFGERIAFGKLATSVRQNPKAAVNADLLLNIVESSDGLALYCDYNTDLYNELTISSWLNAFEDILEQICNNASMRVGATVLPGTLAQTKQGALLSPEGRHLITSWNDTQTDFPENKSIVDLFEEIAASTPDAEAIIMDKETLSYHELNQRANQLARELAEMGVSSGDLVTVLLPRSFDLIASIFASLKVGAAYVPIDTQAPEERISYVLADSDSVAIITNASLSEKAGQTACLLVDEIEPTNDREASENLDQKPRPDSLAYVIYTSGSTGRPKGVMVQHRSVVQLVRNSDIAVFGGGETSLLSVSVAFDPSLLDIFGMLLNEGKVVIMPPEPAEPAAIARFVQQHDVTSLFTTTGVFHVLAEDHLDELGSLKQICVGGEVLSPVHAQKFIEALDTTTLIAAYGPTEATTIATFTHYRCGDQVPNPVPIGKPMSNTRVYIVNDAMRPVAIGERGELIIAGDGLAVGYLNNPDLSRQKFFQIEIIPGKPERAYRTGDLVSFTDDGALMFHGRLDGQVKLRGYRIELGEIEAELAKQPGVAGACVVPIAEEGRVQRLVAFCVGEEGARLDQDALKAGVSKTLMAYMVPNAILILDSFPLNVNDKIDRDALLKLAQKQTIKREFVGPENNAEETLCKIVEGVMKLDRVGVTENLFELGLDSLKIFQICSRANKGGVDITPRALMQAKTIRAALVENTGTTAMSLRVKPNKITRVSRRRIKVNSSLMPINGHGGADDDKQTKR